MAVGRQLHITLTTRTRARSDWVANLFNWTVEYKILGRALAIVS